MPPSLMSSNSSRKSSPDAPRRPRSPVSMYNVGYGFDAPKPPRPLVKLEPKKPKPPKTKSGQGSISSPVSHSASRSFSQASFASTSNTSFSTTSTSSSAPSISPRTSISLPFFGKLRRKTSARPPTIFEPPDTPTSLSFLPPSDARIENHQLDKAIRTLGEDVPAELVLGKEAVDENEILEELRDPPPIVSQPHSRVGSVNSVASDSLVPKPGLIPDSKPDRVEPPKIIIPQQPSRPPRSPKRPKTAPSSQSASFSHFTAFPPPIQPKPSDSSLVTPPSGLSPAPLNSARHARTQDDIDTGTRVEQDSSTLTRSKLGSHSLKKDGRVPNTTVEPPSRPETPFLDSTVRAPMQAYLSATWSSKNSDPSYPGRRERRQGWSGEWNRDNLQDVIEGLRDLK